MITHHLTILDPPDNAQLYALISFHFESQSPQGIIDLRL